MPVRSLFRYQSLYQTKILFINVRSFTSSSSAEPRTNRTLQQESPPQKTFWSPRVVFGGSNNTKCTIDQGSIVVNILNGTIESCHPGESKEESRAKRGTTTSLFVDLSNSSSGSCCLSPGLIDVHTHISSLGRNWEGYTTATQAAAAGGITTIIGMPLNSLPPTCSVEVVEQELALANQSSELFIDVGLWGGVLPETASSLQKNNNNHPLSELLAHPYVLGLKAFLSPLPPGAGYQAVTREQLLNVAKLSGSFQKPILVHSELMTQEELEQSMQSAFPDDGSRDNSYGAHVKSRPAKWEQDAVQLVIDCTKYCDMHIVHLSDALGCLPLIQKAKSSQNRKLTVETCPHYLLLDTHQIKDGDVRVKCFPPIREPEQRDKLWDGLSSSLIDMIASDHSPCEPSMRTEHTIKTAWGGLTGLQYQLQATWTASKKVANDKKNSNSFFFDEADIARWWSINPAQLAGLHDDRGSIEPGKQADFVFWDTSYLDKPENYTREYHRWKGDCYYSTEELFGRVLSTWKSGIQVYDGINDKLLLSNGKYIKKE